MVVWIAFAFAQDQRDVSSVTFMQAPHDIMFYILFFRTLPATPEIYTKCCYNELHQTTRMFTVSWPILPQVVFYLVTKKVFKIEWDTGLLICILYILIFTCEGFKKNHAAAHRNMQLLTQGQSVLQVVSPPHFFVFWLSTLNIEHCLHVFCRPARHTHTATQTHTYCTCVTAKTLNTQASVCVQIFRLKNQKQQRPHINACI